MFCNKCGNKLNENAVYCNKCGAEVNNQYVGLKKDKKNTIWSNWIVLILFLVNIILLFVAIFSKMMQQIFSMPVGNGLMLIIVPCIAAMYCIPQLAGIILSGINIVIRKRILVILSFIVSLLSIITTIIAHVTIPITGIIFIINLILSIILSIILLLKIITKK